MTGATLPFGPLYIFFLIRDLLISLFVILRWPRTHGIDVPKLFDAHFDRIHERPSVTQSLSEEGLD
ncbi:hypothetical protein ATN79_47405 [Paraburkholderia caribensis]|nr:hypothetical protein ATN79_47405 [Paraburkholderia caribensis]